eukprot:708485-Rhodomonas_salina.2
MVRFRPTPSAAALHHRQTWRTVLSVEETAMPVHVGRVMRLLVHLLVRLLVVVVRLFAHVLSTGLHT